MSTLKRLTRISEAKHFLANGIIGLTEANDEGKIRRVYLTTNPEIIKRLSLDSLSFDSFDHLQNQIVGYDVVRRKVVSVPLALFSGYVHLTATVSSLTEHNSDVVLALDKPCRHALTKHSAELLGVIEDTRFCYVFSSGEGDCKTIMNVNECGYDNGMDKLIENVTDAPYAKLVPVSGYLILDKKSDPQFIKESAYDESHYTHKQVVLRATGRIQSPTHVLKSVVISA
jgi:hypothetical protein